MWNNRAPIYIERLEEEKQSQLSQWRRLNPSIFFPEEELCLDCALDSACSTPDSKWHPQLFMPSALKEKNLERAGAARTTWGSRVWYSQSLPEEGRMGNFSRWLETNWSAYWPTVHCTLGKNKCELFSSLLLFVSWNSFLIKCHETLEVR